MDYYDEPYVSDEQQKDYDLLVKLSDEVSAEINKNRTYAIGKLLDKKLIASQKKSIVKDFIKTRVDFNNQKITLENKQYLYNEICLLADKLFSDNTFYGNDSAYVINGIFYYENSITFEDVIIAFHNYRLDCSEENLWWLSLILCRYIYTNLSMGNGYNSITFDVKDAGKELKKLVAYVVGFWEKYLKDVNVEPYTLTDDEKRDIYDKMDYDATHFFASQDALEEERKLIDAQYAAKLINQCSKSLYLLLSAIQEIEESDFKDEIKKLRNLLIKIGDTIYAEESDAYGDMENDYRLNTSAISALEKDNKIELLTLTLDNALNKLKGLDTEATLNNRNHALRKEKLPEVEELVEEFNKKYSELLMSTIVDDLGKYYKRIECELGPKYKLLPKAALEALVSAEYLYDMFVNRKAPEGFDYSGIAVLYFQAFETSYDKLVIEPYSDWLETQDDVIEWLRIKKKKEKTRTTEEKEAVKELANPYFSEKFDKKFFISNKWKLVKYLEIGKFHKFMDIEKHLDGDNKYGSILIKYLEEICFKQPIDKNAINTFAESINNATKPRNIAAHGVDGLDKSDLIADKVLVYDETNIKDILNFKNILYALLDFFKQ